MGLPLLFILAGFGLCVIALLSKGRAKLSLTGARSRQLWGGSSGGFPLGQGVQVVVPPQLGFGEEEVAEEVESEAEAEGGEDAALRAQERLVAALNSRFI